MFFSPTQATANYVVSKPTLYKDMSDGTLSYKIDGKKRRRLNAAELDRLYEPRPTAETGKASGNGKDGATTRKLNVSSLGEEERIELAVLREQVTILKAERERERQQLNDQITILRDSLEQSQDSQKGLTLMISDQSETMEKLRNERGQAVAKRGLLSRLFGTA